MDKLDQKDRKILFELSQNSRQTNKQIAKKVGLSEMVVSYHINKLIKNKIINYFYITTNPALFGYFHYKIFLRTKPLADEKEFLKHLKNNPHILWLASTRGNYDYVISLLAKDIHEFSQIYQKISQEYDGNMLQRNVSVIEEARIFSRGYLLNKNSLELKYGGPEERIELDEEDLKLLQIIVVNARKTATKIAKEMNISADKVIYRLKRLQRRGILTGFSTSLNLKLMGMKQYVLALKMQGMVKEKYNQLKEIVKKNQSLLYFIKVVGDREIDIELEIQNDEQLDDLFKAIKTNFVNELREYELLEVTEEHKLNFFPF